MSSIAIELGTAYISVLPDTSKLAPAIKSDLKGAEREAARSGERAGGGFAAGLKTAVKRAGKAGLIGLGVAAGATLVGGFKAGIDQQSSKATLSGLYGSAKVAEGLMKDLRKVSKTSVIDYSTYTQAAEALAYMGIEGKDAPKMLENIGDAIAGAGGGAQELDRASDALLNMTNAGKVQLDHLNQLSGAGVPVFSALAEEIIGDSSEESIKRLREMVSKGEVEIADVQKVMMDGNSRVWKQQKASAKEGEKTLSGQFKMLKDNVLSTMGSLFNSSGFGDWLADMVGKASAAFDRLVGWVKRNREQFERIGGAIKSGFGWLKDNWQVIAGFAGVLLSVAAAVKVWSIAQGVLNAVLAANPISLIVIAIAGLVAGLIYAYKHSETFRMIVDKAWAAIKKAITWAWDKAIKPALKAFGGFIKNILWPIIRRLWQNVKPVFKAIGKAIKWTWNKIIKPAFVGWWWYISKVLWPTIKFLWTKVVKPVFKSIGRAIKFAWNRVIKPAFVAWKAYFTKVLWPAIRFLWTKVVKPVFSKIGSGIKATWNKVIKPVFNALKNFITKTLPKAFRKGRDAIGKAWEKLKGLAAKPINFIIGTVYNNGLRKFFNAVMKKLKLDLRLPTASLIGGGGRSATGGPTKGVQHGGGSGRFASGGVLPGYTPGRDVHHFTSPTGGRLHLSGGEAIMRPEWTKAVGGPKAVAEMNRKARAFARGGVWMPGSRSQHTSGYGFARWAGDINSPNDLGKPVPAYRDGNVAQTPRWGSSYGHHVRINHPQTGEQTLYAHLSRIAVRVGQAVRAGQTIGNVGSTGNSTGPHLHFEIRGGSAPIDASGGGGGGGGMPGWLAWVVNKGLDRIKDGTLGLFDKIPTPNTAFAEMGKGAMREAVDAAFGWASDKVSGLTAQHSDGNIGSAAGISGPVVSQVRQVAKQFGWGSGSQWNALVELVRRESSWNPNAANPRSSARGLFQKMTSIHGAVESSAAGQALWGLNYIKGRYGNPAGALGFHNRNNWYSKGGVFDTGGILEPGAMAVNLSKKPEAVFTHQQFKQFAERDGDRPRRVEMVITNWKTGEGYMREIANDTYTGERAYADTRRRMGGR